MPTSETGGFAGARSRDFRGAFGTPVLSMDQGYSGGLRLVMAGQREAIVGMMRPVGAGATAGAAREAPEATPPHILAAVPGAAPEAPEATPTPAISSAAGASASPEDAPPWRCISWARAGHNACASSRDEGGAL